MEMKMKKKRRAFVNEDDCVSDLFDTWIFQHFICMAWASLFLHSIDYFHCQRNERVLQPLLRAGTAIRNTGWTFRVLPQSRYSEMDEE